MRLVESSGKARSANDVGVTMFAGDKPTIVQAGTFPITKYCQISTFLIDRGSCRGRFLRRPPSVTSRVNIGSLVSDKNTYEK